MNAITVNNIPALRLAAQQLAGTDITTPAGMVQYFGGMQAQDFAMSKWAIGSRLPVKEHEVTKAIDDGLIIRTHVLRSTWHLVAATDARWMLSLTAPHVKKLYMPMCSKLGIDEKLLWKYSDLIGRLLRDHKYLTREEIMTELKLEGSMPNDIRPSLIMIHAEMKGIVCNGPMRGKQFTYALFDERVQASAKMGREEALAALAERYFTSHGPATIADFAWWSGLPVTDAKRAAGAMSKQLISLHAGQHTYWMHAKHTALKPSGEDTIHLLPAFDELLISYKDRTAAISETLQRMAFTRNGIFKPIIVVNGIVTGTWKRIHKKDAIHIELEYFGKVSKALHRKIASQAALYGAFYGMKVVVL